VARYDYGPFGEPLAESGEVDACPFRWQTKWYDAESQHYYFGYRHYDPRFGRWLSRDPLGEAGGFNLYAYCGNDPVNRHDPLGLSPLYGVDGQTREAMLRIEDERERKERRDNYRNPDPWKIIYLPVALAGIPIAAATLPEIVLALEAAVYSAPVIAFGEFTAAGGLTTLGAKAALITTAAVIGFEAGSGASFSDALQDGGTVGLNIWAATGFGNPNARLPDFGWAPWSAKSRGGMFGAWRPYELGGVFQKTVRPASSLAAGRRGILTNYEARMWYETKVAKIDISGAPTESLARAVNWQRNMLKLDTRNLMADTAEAARQDQNFPIQPFEYY
jgi:RHS repeat-associated protein